MSYYYFKRGSDDEDDQAIGLAEKTNREMLLEFMDKNATAMTKLSDALRVLSPQQPNDAVTRTVKMEKLYSFVIKYGKLRDFKPSDTIDVRTWLQQFEAAVNSIASAGCGLDLAATPLSAA